MSKLPILKETNLASIIYFIRGEKVILDTDLAKLYDPSWAHNKGSHTTAFFHFMTRSSHPCKLALSRPSLRPGSSPKTPIVFPE